MIFELIIEHLATIWPHFIVQRAVKAWIIANLSKIEINTFSDIVS
jgi:hypothetical protein